MPAYIGKEKYIFVSYAREDKEKVFPFIENMQIAGFRVCYHADTDEEMFFSVDEKLEKSTVVLAFVSPNTIDSVNARKDIQYVLENQKELLIVYLKDINSKYGLGKQLESLPSLHQADYFSEISLLNGILKEPILQEYRGNGWSNLSAGKEKNFAESKSFGTQYAVGDTLNFGTYRQNGSVKEDIEWQVLDVKNGKALLLSKNALDCKKYHETNEDITWEYCTLRKWLNSEFLNTAFSESEKGMIQTVMVSADKNPSHDTNPGNATRDQIFLLSIPETKKYFTDHKAKMCKPTKFAVSNGAYVNEGNVWWWLRTPGKYPNNGAYIDSMGTIFAYGSSIGSALISVRPALWIDLNDFENIEKKNAPISSKTPPAPTPTSNSSVKNISSPAQNVSAPTPSVKQPISNVNPQTANNNIQNGCKIGNTVKFGSYQQNGTGKEAIEWQVLDIKDGKALLLSKYGLDSKKYHTAKQDVTWETCTLRKWLNEEFLNNAFSFLEKTMIPTVTVSADRNPTYNTDPGKATQDKVFLLSISEVKKYFTKDTDRICQFTAFAKRSGVKSGSSGNICDWLLRSPGYKQNTSSNVSTSGYVTEIGNFVSVSSYAIRPAIWVDLKAFEKNQGSAGKNVSAVPVKNAQILIEQKRLQKQCKVGNTVKFGVYQQNGTGKEAIEWQVLDIKDGKALVISKYGLDCKPYNTSRTNVTWETCTLRKWLNDEFLSTVFSATEKAIIRTETVSAEKNPKYQTNPGKTTQDKIFLLSIAEAQKYFSNNDERKCKVTVFAKSNGALSISDRIGWWWLRSPGDDQRSAACVHSDGNVREGGIVGNLVDNARNAVRPAMWLDLDVLENHSDVVEKNDSVASVKSAQFLIEQKKLQKEYKVGNTVKFGEYQQNGTSKEDIEWQVLDVKDGKALLVSKYGLDCKKYHETGKDITWEDCTLRKWLNKDFLNAAFKESEKKKISSVTVSADPNPQGSAKPGNATQDKIFLLSIPEAKKYFKSDSDRKCPITEFAKANGAYKTETGECNWMLRSPGLKQHTFASVSVAGYISMSGSSVNIVFSAIRPAMWIDLNA